MRGNSKGHRAMWAAATAVVVAAFVAGIGLRPATAATATFVVDEDGQATVGNCNSSTATPYTTVGAAVAAAAAGDTVKVCPGNYAENVTVDKPLMLKGAKFGVGVGSRTFGSANESTIAGLLTIQAADVKVEGFSLSNPNHELGVLVKTTGSNAVIKKNIVQTVGSNTFVGSTVGVYLEHGPDGVSVVSNRISDVQSQTASAQGILVGDSTSADPSLNTKIDNNIITDITSIAKGAYGVQVNNGASSALTAVGYAEVSVRGNTIEGLKGNWAHAIGLEGETPNAVVNHNNMNNLTDTNPVPLADVIGVYFEDNQFYFTAEVNQNSLNIGSGYGLAVHPSLTARYPSLNVDGECNWWGASSGPSAVGSGFGSKVSAGVDFTPWLKSSNLNKSCGDHDHHDGDFHRGDWGQHGWRAED